MSKKNKKNHVRSKQDQIKYDEAKQEIKRSLSRNKYFWLSGLCALYFLKVYDPAFAWFGALGALGFYKNTNNNLRKLTYISVLAIFGLLGFFL